MSKGLRLTEQWMRWALWLVALVFAGFLIGLGGKVVENLRDVEPEPTVEQFVDHAAAARVQAQLREAEQARTRAGASLEQAVQKHDVAVANTRSARETFENWLATRHVTLRPDQDAELIARTRQLDALKAAEREALAAVQAQQQALLDANQAHERATAERMRLEAPAHEAVQKAQHAKELRVFLYRLALTLPLLLIAGWLFARKRNSTYWPFAWGFIIFALFAFFFELVPYLPSYGGYVRYIVGILLTGVAGRYAIIWLQGYLARQKAAEAMPDEQRRETLRYDVALARLERGLCPGCERSVDLKGGTVDFCPHCGIGLFDHCGRCTARKSAFSRFCFACGGRASASLPD